MSQGSKRRHNQRPHNVKELCEESGRKVRYKTKKRALGSLNALRGPNSKTPTKPTAIYECPHCSGWHLTSRPQGPKT